MLVEAEIMTVARTDKGNAVLVKPIGAEKAVPIFIAQLEAQSILIGLGKIPMPRPLTHDLFINVMETMDISFGRVEITHFKDKTYFARLVLQQGSKKYTIDSRPSDSIALAVRVKCPIYIAESIVDEFGIAVTLVTGENGEEEKNDLKEDERRNLEYELQKAVEEENYEEAARIRDKIKDL
jgi:uncharacterized protein